MHFNILVFLISVIQLNKEQLQALCHRHHALCMNMTQKDMYVSTRDYVLFL